MIFPDDLYQQFKEGNMTAREPKFCTKCGVELNVVDRVQIIDFDEFDGAPNQIIEREYTCPNFSSIWVRGPRHTYISRRI